MLRFVRRISTPSRRGLDFVDGLCRIVGPAESSRLCFDPVQPVVEWPVRLEVFENCRAGQNGWFDASSDKTYELAIKSDPKSSVYGALGPIHDECCHELLQAVNQVAGKVLRRQV